MSVATPVDDAYRYRALRAVVMRATPGQLRDFAAGLEAEDLALLEQVVADIGGDHWRSTPATMAAHLDPEYELYPYVDLLGRKWAQLDDGTDPYQVWNLPAQYGKSRLCQYGLAWSSERHPTHRFITTSYGDELADRNGLAVRDILEGHPDALTVRLRRDQRRKDRFLTEQGGGLLAAGIFAGMTGWPAHGIVIDDPFKGWQEAHSAAHREKVWNTYRSVVWLRRTTGRAWVLIVMTRWHEEDLVGKLVDAAEDDLGVRFTVTRLAELAEPAVPDSPNPVLRQPDPLGRAPGEPLEPRRFDLDAVLVKHKVLGSYLTAGMAQQRPAPEEGTEIKRAWFGLEETVPPRADESLTSWDMKLKDSEAGDYVVGQLWWRVGGGYWLMDQLRGQWGQETAANAIALMAVRWPRTKRHVVENAGNAPEVLAMLRRSYPAYDVSDDVADKLGMTTAERTAVSALRRRGMSGLQPNNAKGDKRVRMRAEAPVVEAGDVHLPAGAHFVPQYLEEMAAFPNGAHDDQVDATSQALSKLTKVPTTAARAAEEGAAAVPTRQSQVPGATGPPASGRGGNAAILLPGVRRP